MDTFAFTTKSNKIETKLINKAIVEIGNDYTEEIALWDTGATTTCISEDVAKKLNLKPSSMTQIITPSGNKIVNVYLVNIILPNKVRVPNVQVCDSDIGKQGIGILIGMNIISLGDFSISNFNGRTQFTYRMPSIEHTDFVQKIRLEKLIGKKHGKGKRKRK